MASTSTRFCLFAIAIYQINSQSITCPTSPTGTTCTLNCDGVDQCKDYTLTCRVGDPCIINCIGSNSCAGNSIIDASGATDVNINCQGSNACKGNTVINCGTSSCAISCGTSGSCEDARVYAPDATSLSCTGSCDSMASIPAPFTITTHLPTVIPTKYPSKNPISPTNIPTLSPTNIPTLSPTNMPIFSPTNMPIFSPTNMPIFSPTKNPTNVPSQNPTISPTLKPTKMPIMHGKTHIPTTEPSKNPTISPTPEPTGKPTKHSEPSQNPTISPTILSTVYDTTYSQTVFPTNISTTNTIILESKHNTEMYMEEQHMSYLSGNNVDIIYLIIGGLIVSLIIIYVGMRMRKKRKAKYFVQDTSIRNKKSEVKRPSIVEEMHGSFGVVKCRLGTDASESIFSSHIISLKNNGLIVGSRVLKNKPQNVYDESDSDDDNNETNILPDDEKIVVYPNTVTSPSEMRTSQFIGNVNGEETPPHSFSE